MFISIQDEKPRRARQLRARFGAALGAALACASAGNAAPNAAPNGAALPVREVTVFKDGNAFVLREGEMPVNAQGEVTLDTPIPVVGTFWPYAVGAKLRGATASRVPVAATRPATSLRDLIKANIGAQVTVIEDRDHRFDATILDVPQPASAPDSPDTAPDPNARNVYASSTPDEIVLLQTAQGVMARSLSSLSQIVFKNAPRTLISDAQERATLRLQLANVPQNGRAKVGMAYLQRGLRWIPAYRIALGGQGRASVQMQATLANELLDLQGATVNLVVGVPSFSFQDVIDPIALRDTVARLSPLFTPGSPNANAFSNNSFSTQEVSPSYVLNTTPGSVPGSVPGVASGANEDYFLFTVPGVTLRKGERTTFSLANYNLKYADLYTLYRPAAPPAEVYRAFGYDRQHTIDAAQATKVMHQLRIFNTGTQPLTTAPALIESGGRLLSQTLMTYTATGGRSDIALAPAVDVTVKRRETEAKRTAKSLLLNGYQWDRVDVSGTLIVTSFRGAPTAMEITQRFVGTLDSVGQGGTMRKIGPADDAQSSAGDSPSWSYNSSDWLDVNGFSSGTWTLTVPAKKSVEIPFTYHYFAR